MRRLIAFLLLLLSVAAPARAQKAPLVLAAASLQESMNAAADAWAKLGHPRPVISFAASSALARQVEAGAPADLFVSADEEWMDYLVERGLIAPRTRVSFLRNRLVLIAPAARPLNLAIRPRFPLGRALGESRLAMADPDAVPAGRYGRQALERLGVWTAVAPKVVRAENVRAALVLVERDEARAGIVYRTDALASRRVRVVGTFPATSHKPISYPVARLKTSRNPQAEAFRRFIVSPRGRAIFRRFGFSG